MGLAARGLYGGDVGCGEAGEQCGGDSSVCGGVSGV